MKPSVRSVVAVAIVAAALLVALQSRRTAETRRLEREVAELREAVHGLLDGEAPPEAPIAVPAPASTPPGASAAAVSGAEAERLTAEIAEFRTEFDAEIAKLRELMAKFGGTAPGTAEILASIADPAASATARNKAIWALLESPDAGDHLEEILDLYRTSEDPIVRNSLENVLRGLAVKFRSQAVIDGIVEDLRERGGAGSSAAALAKFYGTEGVEQIGALLGDRSEQVRRAAIQALGYFEPEGEVVASLRSAQDSPDPMVRSLASVYLGRDGESWYYDGLIDDLRAVAWSPRAVEFFRATDVMKPDALRRILKGPNGDELLGLLEELREHHPNETVRENVGRALKGIPARTEGAAPATE